MAGPLFVPPFLTSGALLTYIGAPTPSTSDLTTYTFNTVPIGAAAADRLVIVCASGGNTAGNRTLSSMTIDGNAMTIHINPSNDGTAAAIASRVVAAGTTATIAPTFSSGMLNCTLHVYTLTNYVTTTPYDTGGAFADASSAGTTIDLAADGVCVVLGSCFNSDASVFTNVDEDNQLNPESNGRSLVGHTIITNVAGQAISYSSSGTSRKTIAAVSWR